MAEVKVHGLRKMRHTLRELPKRVRNKVIRQGLRAAGAAVRDAAITDALSKFQGEGFMAEHIVTSAGKSRGRGQLRQLVGIAGGSEAPPDLRKGGHRASKTPIRRRGTGSVSTGLTGFQSGAAYYWRFLEFGTSKMAARPFLRPAAISTRGLQVGLIQRGLSRGVEREARKLAT